MGFIKNFKRDFAQAVNELLPESDEKASKKAAKHRKGDPDAAEASAVSVQQADGVQEGYTGEYPDNESPVASPDVRAAVSEAILREEADRLREEIRLSTERKIEEEDQELDKEIDSMSESYSGEYDEEYDEEYAEDYDPGEDASEDYESEDEDRKSVV